LQTESDTLDRNQARAEARFSRGSGLEAIHSLDANAPGIYYIIIIVVIVIIILSKYEL
jgi:hypothetical protein